MAKKAVLITGAAKRVGAALALHFAQHGYDIGLHYNSSKKDAEKTQKQIEKLGVKCVLFRYELWIAKGIPAFMAQVKKALPHCDALINNASIFERATLMETDEALFDRQMTVNFKAPFFLTQAFAKTFGKGCVINILDTSINRTEGSHFAYLLAKKALAEFTVMAARELGPKIRVGGICPGCMIPNSPEDAKYHAKMKKIVPLQSHPSLDELGDAARWLIAQKHVTGQILFIDGGMHVL